MIFLSHSHINFLSNTPFGFRSSAAPRCHLGGFGRNVAAGLAVRFAALAVAVGSGLLPGETKGAGKMRGEMMGQMGTLFGKDEHLLR